MWDEVLQTLRGLPFHTKVRLDKPATDPRAIGAHVSTGLPRGQVADFRLALPDGTGLHIREYTTYYLAHLDRVDPSRSLVGHAIADMPGVSLGSLLFLKG